MNTVTVNGKTFVHNGSISISNGKVIVDGKDITPESKNINIIVNGNIDRIKVDSCDHVTVTGNAESVETMSGDININGDVNGFVKSMSGDIKCGHVSGKVSTMSGDIKNK